MNGKIFKTLSAMLITATMAATAMVPALAAGTNYTQVAAQNATFTKYLLVDEGRKAPTLSFTYTVNTSEVTPIVNTAGNLNVYRGVGAPTIAAVVFAPSDTKLDTTKVSGYDTYQKTITVDFKSTNIKFSEPGVYRYYIIENKPEEYHEGDGGIHYDVATTDVKVSGDCYRTLDVYVEDNTTATSTTKNLVVTGYVLYDGKIEEAPADTATAQSTGTAITDTKAIVAGDKNGAEVTDAEKVAEYYNYYESYSLTFGKEVTGNQGSRDKYFKISVKLNSPSAATYTVDLSRADAAVPSNTATDSTYVGLTNPTTIQVSKTTDTTVDFYLQDGQYITINGLGVGTTYAVTETEEDYTSTAGISADISSLDYDDEHEGNDALSANTSGTIAHSNAYTGYTNSKNGIVPTGILISATPIIIVSVVVVAGIAFFAVRSAKRKAEEADAED